MHYYKFNIGNYYRETSYLTLIEDLAYRKLLDSYYLSESPIPDDVKQVSRKLGMSEHVDAVQNVLTDFFYLADGFWHQDDVEEKLLEYKANADTARKNGAKGGRPKKENPEITQPVADGNPDKSGLKANHKPLTINHKQVPLTSSEDDLFIKPKVEKVNYQGVIDCYHKYCPDLTKVMKLTEARKKQVKARWNESEEYQNGEFWAFYFQTVASSDFLCGRSSDWKADFQWLTKQENFIKVMEGKYV